MSFNIQVRKKQLQSLDQYISSSKDKVQSILDYLGWNPKKVAGMDDMLTCPFNAGHKTQVVNIQKHVEKCCLLTSGYQLDDQFLSDPQHKPKCSISIDNSKKIEILNEARSANPKFKPGWNGLDPDPMTSDKIFSTFSPDERLALYNYCVQNTEGPPEPCEFNVNISESGKVEDKDLTKEELRQRERNAKRRRIKYKSVHTGRNKSHTEVMREVIGNQMEMYQEYLINKQKEEAEIARQLELQDVDEQFDQPDASNLIYDFDNDASSPIDPCLGNYVNHTNTENYTPFVDPYSATACKPEISVDPSNLDTSNPTIDSSYIDNTGYDYQEYIQNILSQPQNEYDKKIKEYSEKVNQLRVLKERDRKHDHLDHYSHRDHRSRRDRSSHREKDRRHVRDHRNGHDKIRYSRDSRDRRESHHRSERRH